MTPKEKRQNRISELQHLVDKLFAEGKDPGYILSAVTKRARQMASYSIANEYIEEIITRNRA